MVSPELGLRARCWINRNIYLQNRAVCWPVHFTSQVISGDRIFIAGLRGPGCDNGPFKSFIQSGGCYYQGKAGITFEERARWGPGCAFISANRLEGKPGYNLEVPRIRIGEGSRLGAGVIVLPGVEIGPGSIVGAGAVLTHSFPQGGQVIAGNPASIIRRVCL